MKSRIKKQDLLVGGKIHYVGMENILEVTGPGNKCMWSNCCTIYSTVYHVLFMLTCMDGYIPYKAGISICV